MVSSLERGSVWAGDGALSPSRIALALLISAFLLSGCIWVEFGLEGAAGQLHLMTAGESIESLRKQKRLPAKLDALLQQIPLIKDFATEHGLRPTKNYEKYIQLNRQTLVWVVVAAENLSLSPRSWSFPLLGSFPYVGWYRRSSAERFAQGLKKQGYDVFVRGSDAYSTLGLFEDPLISTMIKPGPNVLGELVNIVLHESVHATLHIPSQSHFNESLANFVADRLTPLYLRQRFGESSPWIQAYRQEMQRKRDVKAHFQHAYETLDTLYLSELSETEKMQRKREIFDDLHSVLNWQTEGRRLFSRRLNNAALAGFKTYEVGVEAFAALFEQCGRNWNNMLSALASLTPEDFPEPQSSSLKEVLAPLHGCTYQTSHL